MNEDNKTKTVDLHAQIRAVFSEMGGRATLEELADEVLRRGVIHPVLLGDITNREIQKEQRKARQRLECVGRSSSDTRQR